VDFLDLPRRVAETLPVGMDCILGNLFELILVPQIRIGKKKSGFIEKIAIFCIRLHLQGKEHISADISG